MQALIRFFVELSLLRRPPQDLPASELLLAIVLLADIVVGVLVGLAAGINWLTGLVQGIAEVLIMLTALYAALAQFRMRARFIQAATALLGSGALLGLAAIIPLSMSPTGTEPTDVAALGALLLLAIVVWGILVTGHILRHTFGLTLGQGAAIAVAFEVVTVTLVTTVFGGA